MQVASSSRIASQPCIRPQARPVQSLVMTNHCQVQPSSSQMSDAPRRATAPSSDDPGNDWMYQESSVEGGFRSDGDEFSASRQLTFDDSHTPLPAVEEAVHASSPSAASRSGASPPAQAQADDDADGDVGAAALGWDTDTVSAEDGVSELLGEELAEALSAPPGVSLPEVPRSGSHSKLTHSRQATTSDNLASGGRAAPQRGRNVLEAMGGQQQEGSKLASNDVRAKSEEHAQPDEVAQQHDLHAPGAASADDDASDHHLERAGDKHAVDGQRVQQLQPLAASAAQQHTAMAAAHDTHGAGWAHAGQHRVDIPAAAQPGDPPAATAGAVPAARDADDGAAAEASAVAEASEQPPLARPSLQALQSTTHARGVSEPAGVAGISSGHDRSGPAGKRNEIAASARAAFAAMRARRAGGTAESLQTGSFVLGENGEFVRAPSGIR